MGEAAAAANRSGVTPSGLLDNYSLEMTAKDAVSLEAAAPLLSTGTPVSVTYLPGEGQPARVAAAALARRLGFLPVPHISARRLESEAELEAYLGALASEADLDRCFVVAGDCAPKGPFPDALAVIRAGLLARYGVERVGISGYPQGHPEIPADVLWSAMMEKHQALLSLGHEPIITTQFAFDLNAMLEWVGEVRARGITSTIRLGVPGPATIKSLVRFASRCGVSASTSVLRKYGTSITQLLTVAGPDKLLMELAARYDVREHGDLRIHLYPFGGLERTAQWAQSFIKAHT